MVTGRSPNTRMRSLTEMGVPFDGERFPMQLSEDDLKSADLVIAVKEGEHRAMMEEQFPAWADRIEYWHVDDLDCTHPRKRWPTANSALRNWSNGSPRKDIEPSGSGWNTPRKPIGVSPSPSGES